MNLYHVYGASQILCIECFTKEEKSDSYYVYSPFICRALLVLLVMLQKTSRKTSKQILPLTDIDTILH